MERLEIFLHILIIGEIRNIMVQIQCLIKWKGYSSKWNSWEPKSSVIKLPVKVSKSIFFIRKSEKSDEHSKCVIPKMKFKLGVSIISYSHNSKYLVKLNSPNFSDCFKFGLFF